MVSSAEMVLWAIHHATTLLFGVFASAALCGVEINRRHALELVLVGAVTGCAFGLANAVGGELFARQVYPLVVHLPLVIYLCARYRLSQTELGNLADVSRQTISLIERGDYNPSVTLALKLAKILNASVEQLFSYTEEEQ